MQEQLRKSPIVSLIVLRQGPPVKKRTAEKV
jgi:hypothetical protein